MAAMYETNLVGKRQEILDQIFNVEAEKTPFLSSLKTGKTPEGMLCSWVAEVNPAAPSTGVLDGTAATAPGRVDRVLIEAYAQHFRQEWGVTTLAQLTNTAGGGRNEAGHQMAKAMMLLKRQIEQQFLSADDTAVESNPTPFTNRGTFSWLSSSAQSVKPVDATIRPSPANNDTTATASYTEQVLRGQLESMYTERKAAVDLVAHVGVDLKAVIDDFTNIYPVASTTSQPRTAYHVNDPTKYINTVEFLRFSTGNVRVMLNPFLAFTTSTGVASSYSPKSGVFIDPAMWDIGWLMKPANTNLAADGSGKKGFVDAVAILRCLNPKGQGYHYVAT